MSFILVASMTAAELFGNAHLKWFAEEGKHHNFLFGFLAWLLVLALLIKTLQAESMMWTCIMWEAMVVVGGALTAWLVFGEKITHWVQLLGILFAVAAAICVNWNCHPK
jgi:multidrug transporter EmrE-like cation transporter